MNDREQIDVAVLADAPLVRNVRALLDAAPGTPVKELARHLAMSLRTLQRRLRLMGTSYQREVVDARLRVAKKLMEQTGHPIKWIAIESGYASLQHFSNFFRDHVGVSPSQWRTERER